MNIYDQLYQWAGYYFIFRAVILVAEVIFLLKEKGRKSDVLPNVACGILIYCFFKYIVNGGIYGMHVYVASYAPFHLEFSWWLLILTLLGADLSLYTYHYFAHKYRFLWADHSVHHSSKDFDMSTNLRGSFLSATYSWIPAVPMLLLGVSPILVAWCRSFVNDYTFFIHTQRIGKLGFLENILNTPSHHRVHHSKNPQYIDKNLGFLFIFWDKIFGTYAEERETCVYGMVKEVESKNPLVFIFHGWVSLARDIRSSPGFKRKAGVFFATKPLKKPAVKQSSLISEQS